MKKSNTDKKRFSVAFSFAGENRLFVSKVVDALASGIPRKRLFYDSDHQAELARPDLDTYLQNIYHNEAELIAVFLCANYDKKEWCGLEWRAVRDLIKKKKGDQIILFRFDNTQIPGLFSLDGYVSIGTKSPQAVANLIISRLTGSTRTVRHQDSIKSSGSWVLLGTEFLKTERVISSNNPRHGLILTIRTNDSRSDAALAKFRPGRFQGPAIPYAHKDEAWLVNVVSVESQSEGDENLWTLTLQYVPEDHGSSFMSEIATTGYSADQIAELRVSRLLVDDPHPPRAGAFDPRASMAESLIVGVNTRLKADHCPIQKLYESWQGDQLDFLACARLVAVLYLKLTNTIEHIEELIIGPLVHGSVAISFVGLRKQIYVNKEPARIVVKGECKLNERG